MGSVPVQFGLLAPKIQFTSFSDTSLTYFKAQERFQEPNKSSHSSKMQALIHVHAGACVKEPNDWRKCCLPREKSNNATLFGEGLGDKAGEASR